MVEIIKAQEKHIGGILGIWKEFVESQITCEPNWEPGANANQHFEDDLTRGISSKTDLILVALEDGIPIGFAVAVMHESQAFFRTDIWGTISDIAVYAAHQNKGIGEQLLTHTLDWFRSNNISELEVSVLSGNESGLLFWKRNGFSPFSQRLYRKISLK